MSHMQVGKCFLSAYPLCVKRKPNYSHLRHGFSGSPFHPPIGGDGKRHVNNAKDEGSYDHGYDNYPPGN